MKSYRLEWTKKGRDERQVSAVMYGESAAEDYKTRKAAEPGVTDVQVVPVKPGK
ncbi:hypothetical protein ACFVVP_26460 [Streptomyces sp. NPDC058128]|uniref:hypothetical protein n=1 Tax=Streptomyces sp. NPDC058128 TaxID=3346352 RepID=UPI0036E4F363